MAVTLGATVFGFGSYFEDKQDYTDIDLLIVHNDATPASCKIAIQCRHCFERRIGRAHVTMLSAAEDAHFGFALSAQATRLGTVRVSHIENDVALICDRMHKHF